MTHANKIRKHLKRNHIKTITIDVFDTLLMRKIYPEDLQFLIHAEACSSILEPFLKRKINPYHFYSLRKYCRSIIDDLKQDDKYDREAHIEEIFSMVIDQLAQKYRIELDHEQKKELIEKLIDKELHIETLCLQPNKSLIKLLREEKKKGMAIHFISDIYLDSQHIDKLFQHFGINDLFAGGISSSEIGYCKGSGKLFKQVKKKNLIPQLELLSNLHIGDNRISDYLSPLRAGSHAYHYKTWHHRPLRPLRVILGNIILIGKLSFHHRSIRRQQRNHLREKTTTLTPHQKELYQIGASLAPSLLFYLSYIDISSRHSKAPIYFLSSEGKSFKRFLEKLGSKTKTITLKSFNRINTLRAFAYLSLTKPQIQYSQAIIHLFFHGEGKRTLTDLLKSMGISQSELGLSDLALHHMPAEKFVKMLVRSLRGKNHEPLRKIYSQLLQEMSSHHLFDEKKVILGDVGWNGTIQILLEQILQLLNKKIRIKGLYLGTTGHNIFGLEPRKNIHGVIYQHVQDPLFQKVLVEEIWEYVLTGKQSNDEKLQWIQRGIDEYFDFYNESLEYSPDRIFHLNLKRIAKLFWQPNREQILLLGSIEHDTGFGLKDKRTLVDFQYSQWKILRMMFFHPEKFKQLYLRQYWERGFIRWYSLAGFQPIINGLRWLKKKNIELFG